LRRLPPAIAQACGERRPAPRRRRAKASGCAGGAADVQRETLSSSLPRRSGEATSPAASSRASLGPRRGAIGRGGGWSNRSSAERRTDQTSTSLG
jgi:hypothetical protein